MENELQTPHRLTGVVVHGKGIGRTAGMPTANLETNDPLPPYGVYASLVYLDGERYAGVTNIGTRPSVDGDASVTVETLILDFDRDIYGRQITVELHLYLRPITRMESLAAVQRQVEKDSLKVRAFMTALPDGQSCGR